MAAPKISMRASAKPRNSSGSPMIRNEPTSTPGMLPAPPRITTANISTDSQKLNDSGAIMVILVAKMLPAIPAQAAPRTNAAVL